MNNYPIFTVFNWPYHNAYTNAAESRVFTNVYYLYDKIRIIFRNLDHSDINEDFWFKLEDTDGVG